MKQREPKAAVTPAGHPEPGPAPSFVTHLTPVPPRLVRCSCETCGAHTNAIWTHCVGGSCPTCGSYRLIPLEGAELMEDTRLVA